LVATETLVLILLAVLSVGLWRTVRAPVLNSIAVLPLKNLSGDPQQD
jgi:TolB-like protein